MAAGDPPPADPEAILLRQVVTVGTLLKILLFVGGMLVALGSYEIAQLEKLRDQQSALQVTVSGLQPKVDNAEKRLGEIQAKVEKSSESIGDILKSLAAPKKEKP